MTTACKRQKQRIAILTKGDKEFKAALVYSQTQDNEKTSTNDLTHDQANNILIELGSKPIEYDNWAYYNKNIKSHKYLLSLAIQYGWEKTDDKYGQIADLFKISEWLKSDKSPVKKPLKEMSPQEVSKVLTALENMVASKYK